VMTNGPKISAFGLGSRFGWIHSTLQIEPAVTTMATKDTKTKRSPGRAGNRL